MEQNLLKKKKNVMLNSSMSVYILLFTLLINVKATHAQVKGSTYSMFGVGQIVEKSFGINKSLGGTGIAFQSGNTINYLNPASYLGLFPSSYTMEIGIYGIYNRGENQSTTQTSSYVSLNYFSASFYLTNWWASSFGLVPYSQVDYEFNSTGQVDGEPTTYGKVYKGTGGLQRVYMGHSLRIYKGLSLGFNTSYIFGPITQTETGVSSDDFAGYELENKRTTYGLYLDYGLQYSLPVNDWLYTIGVVYGGSKKLHTTDELTFTYDDETTVLENKSQPDIKIPQKIGLGISLKNLSKFRIGIDYEWKNWGSINFSNDNYDTKNSSRVSIGAEYFPYSGQAGSWIERLIYRLGANYNNSYLEIDNTPINSYGINFGIGIPFDGVSYNFSLEYGREGTFSKGLIKNSYLMLYFSMSLNEFWSAKYEH
jgi:hypothetical protein